MAGARNSQPASLLAAPERHPPTLTREVWAPPLRCPAPRSGMSACHRLFMSARAKSAPPFPPPSGSSSLAFRRRTGCSGHRPAASTRVCAPAARRRGPAVALDRWPGPGVQPRRPLWKVNVPHPCALHGDRGDQHVRAEHELVAPPPRPALRRGTPRTGPASAATRWRLAVAIWSMTYGPQALA